MLTFQRDILIQAGMLLRRLGFRNDPPRQWVRAALLHGVLLAAFGIFLPFLQGVDFYDSILLGAYQAISVVFSAPAAAIRLEPEARFRTALAHSWVCLLYGIAMTSAMILLGIVTVFTTHTVFIGPNVAQLAETGLFGYLLTTAVTLAATWLANRFSPGTAKMLIRIVFFGLLGIFFFRSQWLPDIALAGAVITAVVAIVFVLLLRMQFSPGASSSAAA